MQSQGSYWDRVLNRRTTRRRAIVATGALTASAAFLAACGGDDDSPTATQASGGSPAATQEAPGTAIDSTKGNPGGRLVIQNTGYASTLVLVTTQNNTTAGLAGFTHSGLLGLQAGRPEFPGDEITYEPDLAASLPEQNPDQLTYTIKLKPAKFHNGRTVTSEDVKWSYERYAFDEDSAYKSTWGVWLDSVATPDPETAVVKTKQPYADAVGAMTAYFDAFIMAREHEESTEAKSRLVGSGPFLFVDTEEPVITRFKRNPDYFEQPYPYFDEVHMLGNADFSKRFADFAASNVDVTYRHTAEEAAQIKAARPDANFNEWQYYGFYVVMRADQPPFNDERVRQALSMAIDREALKDATANGLGEPDQAFTWTVKNLGFRKPSELGDSAKYWEYDVQTAKQLLSAADVDQPLKTQMSHWDPTVIGQAYVDQATLIQAQWLQGLGVETEDISLAFGPLITEAARGNFEGTFLFPGGGGGFGVSPGLGLKNGVWSPPEGVTVPTPNYGHINDAELSAAADKQATQLDFTERQQTFRVMEEIMAAKQYRIVTNTYPGTYFLNPKLMNAQVPVTTVNGAMGYAKYWWFDA